MSEVRACPGCASAGRPGRIGNRRSSCRECNAFAQQVLRRTSAALREADPQGYARLRARIEAQVYAERYLGSDRSTLRP